VPFLKKGSFVLADHLKYLEIPLHMWSTMTPRDKQAHLAKVDPTVKEVSTAPLVLDQENQEPCT